MTAPEPDDDPELDQLVAEYARLEPLVERFGEIKEALKIKLTGLYPGQKTISYTHPALTAPMRLVYISRWGLDTGRMKAESPETYARFAKQSGRWELRKA